MTTAAQLGQEAIELKEPAKDDMVLWSVTTIIDVLAAEGLTFWACEQAALAAIDKLKTWQAMLEEEGRDAAVKYIRDARFRRPKTTLPDKTLGTVVHNVCENYGLTGVKPGRDYVEDQVVRHGMDRLVQLDINAEVNLVGRMLNQFDGWAARAQPQVKATEVCVYSPTYGYAGTADAFMHIDGTRFLVDYKSRRKPFTARGEPQTPYPGENALQLAGYRGAEFAAVFRPRRYNDQWKRRLYCLNPTERELAVPMASHPDLQVDTGLVILITSESCEAYPMRCDKPVHDYFLYVLEAFRWEHLDSKNVMGDPLVFPRRD